MKNTWQKRILLIANEGSALSKEAMKKVSLILLLLLAGTMVFGQNLNWAKTEGNVGYFCYGRNQENVQTDRNGNVYTCRSV